jgi:signal peptidase II
MKPKAIALGLIGFLVVLDQVSKALIARSLALYESRPVIRGFLNLVHSRNDGAIFGFMGHAGSPAFRLALALASVVALVLVVFYFVKTPGRDVLMLTALSLILAGALGNNIDRLTRGYVVDFIDVYVKRWHWPVFNVADSCISIGAVLLFIVLFRRKPA